MRIKKNIIGFLLAFTLIELIVVIALLTILGTISYFNAVLVFKNTRDVVRLENLNVIDKSISFFKIKTGFYPQPDNFKTIYYSGFTLWNQGEFGNNAFRQVGIINKLPVDILANNNFSYSLSYDQQEYEVGASIEGNKFDEYNEYSYLLDDTYAESQINGKSLVVGNYNGMILKHELDDTIYLFALPTILARDLTSLDYENIVYNQKLAYKGYGNLPASYSGTIFKVDGGFEFTPNLILIYSGKKEDFINESTRIDLLEKFVEAYSGTILENEPGIADIVYLDIDPDEPSKEVKQISYDIINTELGIDIPVVVDSGDDWLSYDLSDLILEADTRFITQDTNGDFWFATKQGVARFSDGDWQIYTEEDGLADIDTRAIIEDNELFLWFATNKGVTKYDNDDLWTTYDKLDGLIDNDVVAMVNDNDGNIWFATKKGVSMYDGIDFINYEQEKTGLVNKIVTCMTVDSSNNIWFGTIDGLSKFDGTTWTTYTEKEGLIDKSVLSIYTDMDDNIWIGTIEGISKFDGITWTNYEESDGLIDKRVQEIYQDSDGIMWFGTMAGLSKYDGEVWTGYTIEDGLVDNDVQSIYEDTSGYLWVGTKKGVTIFYE